MHRIFRKTGDLAAVVYDDRTRRQRPGLEALEGRQLMSLGQEFLANVPTAHNQLESDNASSSNGLSVAVWVDEFSKTDRDIHAQMFNADGSLRGPKIVVDSSLQDSRAPSVAMDSHGNFVVTWTQTVNGQKDIVARRFSGSGARISNLLTIAGSAKNELDSDVAMDAQGNFVVSYTLNFDGTDPDVLAKRFNSSGVLLQSIVVANSSFSNETNPSVAMSAGGQFAIAWENRDDSLADEDIFLSRYNASGTSIGGRAIAVSDSPEEHPSVALDDAGNAVVAYQKVVGSSFDIKARRVSSPGVVGAEINIANTSGQEENPTVALGRNGGSFVVAYDTNLIGIPGNRTVEVAEVGASNAVGAVFNLPGFPNNKAPALSIDAQGNYLLTYTGGVGSSDTDIFRRRGRLS